MINASNEFKSLLKKGAKLVNYADIILRDGTVLNLEPSDFSLGGFSMSDKTSNGKFEVGVAIGKTMRMVIANHTNKFSAYDFFKSIIDVYVAIKKEDGTVLKERKGRYFVINPTTPSDTIVLDGVDSMYLFDKPYNASTAFPARLQTILVDCCIDCGVNIGFGEFDNWDFEVLHKPTDCTYRQVVSWVAQIAGYNARISNNDYLELVWYENATERDGIDAGNFFIYQEDVIDGGDFVDYSTDSIIDGGLFTDEEDTEYIRKIINLSVKTDDVIITGARVEFNDVIGAWGSDEYAVYVKSNPLAEEREQEIAEYLGNRMLRFFFRPLTCEIPNNPLLESFDTAYIFDRKGNAYFTLLNNIDYSISGSTKVSCVAEDPVINQSSYISESAKAVVQAKRNTEKQISTYDKAVQNMNLLASNAMGLYRESELQIDGSIIYYMSNRPIIKDENGICIFEENSVVYKMTGDGFFVSEDGGLSYTSGFDSEGNAIVNVLSAIGITFDWARGGTLSLGGYDNLNGVIKIYDKNGVNTGVIDNNGMALYAENGVQIILSPLTGLVQRDSDGNEFYGLIYDEVIGDFPQYSEEQYSGEYYFSDYDTRNSRTEEKSEYDQWTGTWYYRRYIYWYEHSWAYWVFRIDVLNQGYTKKVIQLPEVFKNKKWVIRVEQRDFDFANSNNFSRYYSYNYDTTIPMCYEGNTVVGEWINISFVPDFGYDLDAIEKLESMSGVPTPYYTEPNRELEGIADISLTQSYLESIKNEIKTDFAWEYDEENATVTISVKCTYSNYNLNEFARFRVYVVC